MVTIYYCKVRSMLVSESLVAAAALMPAMHTSTTVTASQNITASA